MNGYNKSGRFYLFRRLITITMMITITIINTVTPVIEPAINQMGSKALLLASAILVVQGAKVSRVYLIFDDVCKEDSVYVVGSEEDKLDVGVDGEAVRMDDTGPVIRKPFQILPS
jgi:hypothetical protein